METRTEASARGELTLDGAMSLCGYVCVVAALLAAVGTISDWRRERQQAAWPRAVAIVHRCSVERTYSRLRNAGGPEWHTQCDGRIVVDGAPAGVSFRSHGVRTERDVEELRAWTARHREGSSVNVRYDPDHPRSAVPEPTSMPHAASRVRDDVLVGRIAVAAAVLLLSAGSNLRRRAARTSAVAASGIPV